jgi:hypothetical protein
MLSGVESGNYFTITAYTATTLTLSGGIGSIAVTDTFKVLPPALTTPSGARTDSVYLMAWWEDIASEEDSNIEHPGLGVETCHRSQRRWCVRVDEDTTTVPSTANLQAFTARYMKIAEMARTASATIDFGVTVTLTDFNGGADVSSMNADLTSHISNTSDPHDVQANQVTSTTFGSITSTNVQAAMEEINTFANSGNWHDASGISATEIESALNEVKNDLADEGSIGNGGSDRVGSQGFTAGHLVLTDGSIRDQLESLASEVDLLRKSITMMQVSSMTQRKEAAGTSATIYGMAFATSSPASEPANILMVGNSGTGVAYVMSTFVPATTDRTASLTTNPDGCYDCVWASTYGASGRFFIVGERASSAGAEILYCDNLIGSSWTQVTPTGMTTGGDIAYSIAFDSDNDTLIVGGNNGNLIYSTDGGLTWSAASTKPSGMSTYDIKHIVVNEQGIAIAIARDGSTGMILKSNDGGDNWSDVTPSGDWVRPGSVLVYEPIADRFAFIGIGATSQTYWWRANDAYGNTWLMSSINNPPDQCAVADGKGYIISFDSNGMIGITDDLGVTVYGDGIFENNPDGNVHGTDPWEAGPSPAADPQRAYYDSGRVWVPDGSSVWMSTLNSALTRPYGQ